MTDDTEHEDKLRHINAALQQWQQGDCTLDEQWFAYRIDPTCPLTEAAQEAAEQGADLVESEFPGFVVLTQTCDIVRDCTDRPFVEIAPLLEIVEPGKLHNIERARMPRFAYIPALADRSLVVDLDRVMTIEKSVMAGWQRIPGCRNDIERRRLAEALKRKRSRFAFPNDFTTLAKKLQKRIDDKHDKNSVEGEALGVLREIRVAAAPSWEASKIELFFFFIRDSDRTDFEGTAWHDLQNKWLALVPDSGRFSVNGSVVTYDDLTARDYIDSDPLDLDHLTSSAASDS